MRDGPAVGLALIDALLARGDLIDYHLAHAARADLYRRMGNLAAARNAYERALDLARQEPERRFLARRLAELPSDGRRQAAGGRRQVIGSRPPTQLRYNSPTPV